ncbi:MAG TPA: hypothetical protein DDZ40_00185 [Deltaproteobacteria bacterium]|nr:hypothetical protein [Deltaproteobacteria bacterium]
MRVSSILVTGGAGFIGAHLTSSLLEKGERVVVLDNMSSGKLANLQALKIAPEIIVDDISRKESLEPLKAYDVKKIFHLAAQASVPLSVKDPVRDFEVNVQGTINILEFARAKGASVVFPSTVSVYAPDCPKPISENAVVHASSPYGAAKAAGENYCFAYANCFGVRVVVARLFNVYGPLMAKYVIHDFVRKLKADPRSLRILGDGEQIRDYLYVSDAVRALLLLSEFGRSGQVYNVGSGNPVRITDLARLITDELGLKDVELEYTNEKITGDIHQWYADSARLAALGFKPEVSFAVGLHKTITSLTE